MKIFLIGYRATGKSTVGKILAKKLAYDFLDMDKKVEKETKSTIKKLVKLHGWAYFRQLEQKALFSCCESDNIVVSTGGGIISSQDNIDFILANGFSVWLKAEVSTIISRINADTANLSSRPPLTTKNLLKEVQDMISTRTPLYEKAAHLCIDSAAYSPEKIAYIIMENYLEFSKKIFPV